MSGKYVPPGRRGAAKSDTKNRQEEQDSGLSTLQEIRYHFVPLPAQADGSENVRHTDMHGTLQDSAATPGKLTYIVLFDGANPRWEHDNIIFCRTNLSILPGKTSPAQTTSTAEIVAIPPDAAEVEGQAPIAVFKQLPATAKSGRSYAFDGFYEIDRLDFLQPRSEGLLRMLEQKWSFVDKYGKVQQKTRSQENWNKAVACEWAVIKLRRHAADRKPPEIDRLPDAPSPNAGKSVNEILAELRTGKLDQDAASQQT